MEHQLTEWMQYVNVLAYVGSGIDADFAGARALHFAIENWRIRKIQGLMPSEVDSKIRLIAGSLADADTRDIIGAASHHVPSSSSNGKAQAIGQTASSGSGCTPAFPIREHPCVLDIVAKPGSGHVLETVVSVKKRLDALRSLVDDSAAVAASCLGDSGTFNGAFMAAGDVGTLLFSELRSLRQFIRNCAADCSVLAQTLRVVRPPSEASLRLIHAFALSRVPLPWWSSSAFGHPLVGSTLLERHNSGVGRCHEASGLLLRTWLCALQSRALYFTSVAAQLRGGKESSRSGSTPIVQLDAFSNPVVALQVFVADSTAAQHASPPPVWTGGFELVADDGVKDGTSSSSSSSLEGRTLTLSGLTLCGAELQLDDAGKSLLVAPRSPYYSNGSSGLVLCVRAIFDAGDNREGQSFMMGDFSTFGADAQPQQRNPAANDSKQSPEPSGVVKGEIYRCPVYVHAGHPAVPFAFVDIPCGGEAGLPLSQCIQRQVALFIRAQA